MVNEMQAALAEITGGRWWGPQGQSPTRLYFNGRRDAKIWLQFSDPATLEGARVEVRLERHSTQPPQWHQSQAAQLTDQYGSALRAAELLRAGLSVEETMGKMEEE